MQHELLKAGAERATDVDASPAYIQVARGEAERLGYGDRVTYHRGDFVALASQLDSADIVTLDRVICCYPDAQALVSLSAAHARRFYGLIYPRSIWWVRLFRPIFNSYHRLRRSSYRFFVHAPEQVDAILNTQGFRQVFRHTDFFWQVLLFERA
ncbi:MAG: class I SAM-dependent methyltransferase, partial [Anaerolineae bacterium]|nr:class I SAM-dependent methyltransferase [Anaerolineae bacterium]